jgi:monoamine oxidase
LKNLDCDVIVVGAGVSGLAATASIGRMGKQVICLEAAGRIGGRILSMLDPMTAVPIELGAEFVHGRPSEIWELIQTGGLTAFEHTSRALHFDRGKIVKDKHVGQLAEQLVSRLGKSRKRKDESFEECVSRSRQSISEKDWARGQVEGFNAARKERISTKSLGQDEKAADKIHGDRAFRIFGGYDSIATSLLRSIPDHPAVVRLNSVVERVRWRRGLVELRYRSALDNRSVNLRCRQVVVTVPLGVLQAEAKGKGAIEFDPQPARILRAARSLEFGQVYRVTFRFARAFWEDDERFHAVGFLFSKEKQFPTWWTTHPAISPILTGWTAGSAADQFLHADPTSIFDGALASLSRILTRKIPDPQAIYFHDWRRDPFFRGAYSYIPVNALPARKTLSQPVEDTLFFAGEATEAGGHTGTVHGAIASGLRAAISLGSP